MTQPTPMPIPAEAPRPAAVPKPAAAQVTEDRGAPIRVLLADDQALLRSAFRVLVDSEPDMVVVGEAADGARAVELARAERADVVLMDIRMPGTDGLAATRMISADPELSAVRVVMLTTFEVDEYVVQSLRAGASGFLGKGAEPEELLNAIRIAAAGEALLSRRRPRGSSPRSWPRAAATRGRGRAPRSTPNGWRRSPAANARCWSWSRGASPTTGSASGSRSARSPSRPM